MKINTEKQETPITLKLHIKQLIWLVANKTSDLDRKHFKGRINVWKYRKKRILEREQSVQKI